MLFLISGYMQWQEVMHAWLRWQPQRLSWWSTLFGTLGGLFFTLPSILGFWNDVKEVAWFGVDVGFLIGSCCFLINGYLLIVERVNP